MVVVAFNTGSTGYESQYELEIRDVRNIDGSETSYGLIYDGNNLEEVLSCLRHIKKSLNPKIYCKAIVLLSDIQGDNIPEIISLAVDAVIPVRGISQSPKTAIIINGINERITSLELEDSVKDKNIILRLLRYVYCKDITLYPSKNIKNKYGYSYYSIAHLLEDEETLPILILRSLENKALMESTYVDKAHACPECSSVFINFKEVCPECMSSHIVMEDLIHHYVCANLTPESTYKKYGQSLTCPKCLQELKRVGVDFDKPSVMFKCKKCEKDFQEPDVVGECFNCCSKFPSELLDMIEFREYSLTAIGKNAAKYGLGNLIEEMLDSEQNVVDYKVFKKLVAIEYSRIRRYQRSTSSLAVLHIAQGDKLLSRLKNLNVLKEIAKEIKLMLRTTDVLTSFSDMTFGILMTETDIKGSELALSRLVKNIDELLKSNIHDINEKSTFMLKLINDVKEEEVTNLWNELDV